MPDQSPPTTIDGMRSAAAALEATLPTLRQEGASGRWPRGVSPALTHALKRIERWRAGDPRPVVVLVMPDRRCIACVRPGAVDGAVEQLAQGRAA